jgi:hypothetical protein
MLRSGVTPAGRVRGPAFGRWRKLGYRVRAGEKGLRIFGPVTRRLRADEVASWLAQGGIRSTRTGGRGWSCAGSRWSTCSTSARSSPARARNPSRKPELDRAAGRRPGRAVTGAGRHDGGRRFHPRRACGQVRGRWGAQLDQFRHPDGVGEQRLGRGGTGADPGARDRRAHLLRPRTPPRYFQDIGSSTVEDVADWSRGDTDMLRATAEIVHRVAAAVLADLDDDPRETAG